MSRPTGRSPESFNCPHCGAPVAVGAISCRECGSDAETGWSDEAGDALGADGGYDDGDEFDYDDFVRREFPDQADREPARQTIVRWLLAAVVVAVCLGLVWSC